MTADAYRRVTVLITDIEDSTRLWERYPDAMDAIVITHVQDVAAATGATGGRVVKSTGDGVLATFEAASAAVRAAIEIQRRSSARTWPGAGPVRVRIGISTGLCRFILGDILGRPPNLAARIQSSGHGGQILVSEMVAEECDDLDDGTRLVDLGRYFLRGFDEPIGIRMVRADGLPDEFPPLRVNFRGFEDLPTDRPELFGRDALLREIPAHIAECPLVTLWGPPGVGKTSIAVRVATDALGTFDDGARFVDLSTVDDDDAVAGEVARGLRVRPGAGEGATERVVRALQVSRLLLVLDNCEQVVAGVRSLARAAVTAAPSARILTTSREPLGVAGERAVPVPPLSLPDGRADTIAAVMDEPSVQLFVARARRVQPSFVLADADLDHLVAQCHAAGGLPLAIELSAARAAVAGIDSGVDRSHGNGALSSRLATSLARLDDQERELFHRLAVFSGPFTRELARSVARDRDRVDGHLDQLVRVALVQRNDDRRYSLIAPVSRFAREQPAALPWSALLDIHADVMLARAEAHDRRLRTADEAAAIAAFRAELADCRAAIEHLRERGRLADAGRLAVALFTYCLFQARPDGQELVSMLADAIDDDTPGAADVFGAAAQAAWFAGDPRRAIRLGLRAVEVAEHRGGSDYWARSALVGAFGYLGELTQLVPHYLALVEQSRRSEEPFWQINGLGFQAISLAMAGQTDAARTHAERALARARELRNPDCLHWAFYAMGRALAPIDAPAAIEAYEQAMHAARQVGSTFNAGLALVEWVALERAKGALDLAVSGAIDLLDLIAVSGNRAQLARAVGEAAFLLIETGRTEAAAVTLLARDGLPTMPKGFDASDIEGRAIDALETQLPGRWMQLRLRGLALTEQELLRLCRDELSGLARHPPR